MYFILRKDTSVAEVSYVHVSVDTSVAELSHVHASVDSSVAEYLFAKRTSVAELSISQALSGGCSRRTSDSPSHWTVMARFPIIK